MPDNGSSESAASCFGCGVAIDTQDDEWWAHSWDERPAAATVEKALERDDFRDWFQENKILCPTCHKDLIAKLLTLRENNDVGDGEQSLQAGADDTRGDSP